MGSLCVNVCKEAVVVDMIVLYVHLEQILQKAIRSLVAAEIVVITIL